MASEGPGPNPWSASNVWVDSKGYLHLKVSQKDGKWSCAEIWTTEPLGFGTYECHTVGRVDKLDQNLIFSMFSYAGPDGVNEIDIEYAKWGKAEEKSCWWTVYPNDATKKDTSQGYAIDLKSPKLTSRYTWTPTNVDYAILGGFEPLGSKKNLIDAWNFAPSDPQAQVPQSKEPLHFNLWLFKGNPPTDGKPVEIVVRDFKFVPAKD